MDNNKEFLEKWKQLSGKKKSGVEWTLFTPPGAKPRTQRQFNLYSYYKLIHRLIAGKNYKTGVELGAGRGTISLFLNQYDGLKMTLVDVAEDAIKLAKENFKVFGTSGEFVVADAQNTRLPGECCDLIVSIGLLEHIPDYQKVLEESYRLLKSSGTLIALNIPNKFSVQKVNEVYKFFLRPFIPREKLKKDYYRNGDKPERYLTAAQNAGFKNCRTINVNLFPIWTPIPAVLEYPIALIYRFVLWIRSFFKKEPLETGYWLSQGHFLIGHK